MGCQTMVTFRPVYVSAGCEARSHCLAASRRCNKVVFASNSRLVVADADRPFSCLESVGPSNHIDAISCAKRVHSEEESELFLSGGLDGRVNLCSLLNNGNLVHLTRVEVGWGMKKATSISAVAGWAKGKYVTVVAATRGKILIAHVAVDYNQLSSYLVAVGTSRRSIDVYSAVAGAERGSLSFSLALRLPDAHEDWVHSLAFDGSRHSPLLASSGQDSIVKLWRFERREEEEQQSNSLLQVKRLQFDVNTKDGKMLYRMAARIDAVLSGHEDWVHSVHWEPSTQADSDEPCRLVTAGSDKAVVVWERLEGGIWADTVRLGVIGGQAAGFYSAVITNDRRTLVATSFYGGVHAWTRSQGEEKVWEARAFGGGHCGEVTDCSWSPGGSFLLSVSSDKTTRLHSLVQSPTSSTSPLLVELGRPQVHGHELTCVATLPQGSFVSGAEEKILRTFSIPRSVAESLQEVAGHEATARENWPPLEGMAWGAAVPSLGLSNNPVHKGEQRETGSGDGEEGHWEEAAFVSAPAVLHGAPTEEFLQQNTLWPETAKLYGHGFELHAVASSPDGETLVSAARASQPDHAALLRWSPPSYSRPPSQIPGHNLTVTKAEFSPDGKWLLSVSRDRTIVVYGRGEDGEWKSLWQSSAKGGVHSRIIFACAWFDDSRHFVTVSRDAKVVVWKWSEGAAECLVADAVHESATAVAVARLRQGEELSDHLIVVGCEGGSVRGLRVEGGRLVAEGKAVEGAEEGATSRSVTRLSFAPHHSPPLLAVTTTCKKLLVFEISQSSDQTS